MRRDPPTAAELAREEALDNPFYVEQLEQEEYWEAFEEFYFPMTCDACDTRTDHLHHKCARPLGGNPCGDFCCRCVGMDPALCDEGV